ncbi:hypothetical protein BSZ35_19060 [Salinibacter sp. 10B]|uniref:hypothetical protein n=1 Tax=Salinibacter sp. 10B TaxID=1923971 RepID=UPI000CF52CB6|nr:hypothetical protein [Salinibacter sp. 10B]PQJ26749.1 hypothetical protein BSZ35_19060 [Salinibacter sp. 10B]
MNIHIPDELEDDPDAQRVVQKLIDKVPAFMQLRRDGAKLEATKTGGDNCHVRLYDGAIDHDHLRRGQ